MFQSVTQSSPSPAPLILHNTFPVSHDADEVYKVQSVEDSASCMQYPRTAGMQTPCHMSRDLCLSDDRDPLFAAMSLDNSFTGKKETAFCPQIERDIQLLDEAFTLAAGFPLVLELQKHPHTSYHL